jgi:hypothetical protein
MIILQQTRANLSSGDQLSLDLPFAATKSIAARVGPTPTFTRGSGATYIGSDGLIHGVDTSTTSNTIGTGSRTFTLAATAGQDKLWRAGDAVEASNGANSMVGTVTSYTPSTQSLVCNMTSIGGGGTFTSWRIGYRGPRFDHTSAGVCRGLLIEEARTNLAAESGNASLWPNSNGTVTKNGSTTAPDGSSNGFLGGIGNAGLVTGTTSSVTGIYTASVFLKRNNTDWVRLQVSQGAFAHAVNFWVNLATGAAGTLAVAVGTPTSLSAQVTPFGNSWYRVSITASYPTTNSLTLTVISATADNNTTRVSGSVYEVWGGQLEAGAFATSYIPTTTGSVVRSADVCDITGGNFTSFYNQSEGTFSSNWSDFSPVNINNWPIPITTNSNFIARSNGYSAYNPSSPGAVAMTSSSVTLEAHYSRIPNILIKQASAYSGSGMAISANGLAVRTNPALFVTNQTFLKLHGYDSGSQFNGHFAAIRYYKKRLPNAKLQSLTA